MELRPGLAKIRPSAWAQAVLCSKRGVFSGLIIAATFKHHLHNHEQFHIQIRTKMASWTAPLNIDRGWSPSVLIVIEWAAKTSLSWPWHHPDIQHIGCSTLTPAITRLVLQAHDRHIALWWRSSEEGNYIFARNFGIYDFSAWLKIPSLVWASSLWDLAIFSSHHIAPWQEREKESRAERFLEQFVFYSWS